MDLRRVQSRWEGRRLKEVEVGRVVGKEGVQVPGDGVLLIIGVVYDMLRDGVNTSGQCTMRNALSVTTTTLTTNAD